MRTETACSTPWFVVNPHAGGVHVAALSRAIKDELGAQDAIIASAAPETTAATGPRLVVAVGGDGTVNRVINRCAPAQLRLGIIPRGSANDLGTSLLLPRDLRGAWGVIEARRYSEIDLVSVNGRRFVTCGGLGLATDVAARANAWKARRGWRGRLARGLRPFVYALAALREVLASGRRPVQLTAEADGVTMRVPVSSLLVSNQARFGRFFSASPGASNRDGLLHLCGVRFPRSRARLLWICLQFLLGRPERCPEIVQWSGRSVTLETDAVVAFFGDGEILARGRRFRIEVLPRALKVATADGVPDLEEAA